MKVQSIQPTPNPNAFKFLVDEPLAPAGENRHHGSAQDCTGDALSQGLFAIPGVESLFFCDNFVTVSMTGSAEWRTVAEQVTQLLESHEPAPAASTGAATAGVGTEAADPLASLPSGSDPELLRRINDLLDDRVRPALAGDGGGLEVVGLDGKTLAIRYQGACGSCPSSIQGTLYAIQNLLQSEVDESLVVVTA